MSNAIVAVSRIAGSFGLRFDAERVHEPDHLAFNPAEPRLSAAPVGLGGRNAAWFVQGEFGEGVLRQYRRGGMAARVSRERYVWMGAARTRSFAEFDILAQAHAEGLPVPRPVAAAWWRCGPTYRAAIIVSRIPHATPLAVKLDAATAPAVARALFTLHDAGFRHADLNAFNILFDGSGCVWLIDFDRAARCVMTAGRCRANLLRLRRSLVKVAGAGGERYWRALDAAYQSCRDVP